MELTITARWDHNIRFFGIGASRGLVCKEFTGREDERRGMRKGGWCLRVEPRRDWLKVWRKSTCAINEGLFLHANPIKMMCGIPYSAYGKVAGGRGETKGDWWRVTCEWVTYSVISRT